MPVKSKDPGPWVDRLVPDPAAPPRLSVLSGYRARSTSESSVRLYLQADLSSWFDVPVDAVLHESEATDALGLVRTWLWVKAEAAVAAGQQPAAAAPGWLGGPIATALAGEAGYAARAHGVEIEQPVSVLCRTMASPECVTLSGTNCPTNWRDCPPATVRPALCPTQPDCPGPMTHDCPGGGGYVPYALTQPRTITQPATGIDPACPTNLCTLAGCKTSWGPLCPNPPQPAPRALQNAGLPATSIQPACPTNLCTFAGCQTSFGPLCPIPPQPTTQDCPSQGCPPSAVACPPRTLACPSQFCPTNFQLCPTVHAGCNTVLCPTQYATCPPSFGYCPTLVCEPFGGGGFGR